jgi:hypothetical protein
MVALGGIGRHGVQQRFVEIIVAPAIEADLRETAARQLAVHIQRYGRLVTEDAITALTDAWSNASEPRIRTALSAVLGVLKPTPDSIFDKLINHPIPDVPQP